MEITKPQLIQDKTDADLLARVEKLECQHQVNRTCIIVLGILYMMMFIGLIYSEIKL